MLINNPIKLPVPATGGKGPVREPLGTSAMRSLLMFGRFRYCFGSFTALFAVVCGLDAQVARDQFGTPDVLVRSTIAPALVVDDTVQVETIEYDS